MTYIVDNLRLKELIFLVQENRKFYNEFLSFLQMNGYENIYEFVNEKSDSEAEKIIHQYLITEFKANLLDGIGRIFDKNKAKWYFLAWLFRDAASQRLEPLLRHIEGNSSIDKKTKLLNQVRKFISPLLPEADSWTWAAISEVMLARLEGSRRALKGGLIENIIRSILQNIFEQYKINLKLSTKEVKLNNESYDISILGSKGRILIPVKTRETMGGGHASLFTRDIFKSISVAKENGYNCLPIIIAESWTGNLAALECENYIAIAMNPNQIEQVQSIITKELLKLIDIFKALE